MRPCLYPGCPNLVTGGYCEKHKNRKRYCAHPGCPVIVTEGAYCNQHNPNKIYDKIRGKTTERGYDRTWQKTSKSYLAQHPLCEECERHGRTTPAVLVHHKNPLRYGGERLEFSNLEALCRACHDEVHKKLHDAVWF